MRASGEQKRPGGALETALLPALERYDDNGDDTPPWIVLLKVCAVGFFVNCQPSEPFLTRYLVNVKGLSHQDLNDHVWPYDTYGSFAFLLPVGLLADCLGYRVVILAGLLCREATRLLLIFGGGITQMSLMQLAYAAATATNTVYFSYVYLIVEKKYFMLATGMIIASYHLGNATGSFLCQILDSFTDIHENLTLYFYISWCFTSMGLLTFLLWMPQPQLETRQVTAITQVMNEGWSAITPLWEEITQVCNTKDSTLWASWWILGGVTFPVIISNMYQSQFEDRWKGGPVCLPAMAMEVLSSLGALAPTYFLKADQGFTPHRFVAGSSCVCLAVLYYVTTLKGGYVGQGILSYVGNTLAVAIYHFQSAVASSTIASATTTGRYALIFTLTQFIALAVACVVSTLGAEFDLHTDEYFRLAAVGEAILGLALFAMECRVSEPDTNLSTMGNGPEDGGYEHMPNYTSDSSL